MIENQGKPDIDNLLRKISNYVTDYDGSRIVRGAEPMPGLHCGVLYDAADIIEALRTSLAKARAQIAEKQKYVDDASEWMASISDQNEHLRAQIAAKDAALNAASALAVCGMAVDCYSREEIADISRATRPTFIEALTAPVPAPAQEDKP